MEVNNGRHLTLFDLGRFDLGARTGLLRILKERRWGLVVAGSTIRYRKRLSPFQRYQQHTHLVARDDRWFYFVQTTVRKGEACSSALIRTGVTSGGRVIASQEVADALGYSDWNPPLPEWVKSWAEADGLRPWPPQEM
jgi:acyl-CoA thioesterase FadM